MRIGLNPSLWPRSAPYPEIAEIAAELGYSGIEGMREFFDQPQAMASLLADTELELTGGYFAANWFDPDWRQREFDALRAVAERYADCGAGIIVAAQTGSPHRFATAGHFPEGRADGLSDWQWGYLGEGLSLAGEFLAEEFGLQLGFHNHAGTFVETQEECDALIDRTDPDAVALAPDTGQLLYGGIDPLAFFETNLERIAYVHLKDVDGQVLEDSIDAGLSFREASLDGVFTPLGQGECAIGEVAALLSESDYRGWLVVEQDYSPLDPAIAAGESLEFLASQLGS